MGKRIAAVRRQRGLTQERLAELLGMEPRDFQRIERGGRNITLHTLARVAQALGVHPSMLTLETSDDPLRAVADQTLERSPKGEADALGPSPKKRAKRARK